MAVAEAGLMRDAVEAVVTIVKCCKRAPVPADAQVHHSALAHILPATTTGRVVEVAAIAVVGSALIGIRVAVMDRIPAFQAPL